jgi:hypothetical protein
MRVVLHLSWIDTISWIAGSAFEVALVALILLRKPTRQAYLFSVYFVFLLCRDLWWFFAVRYVPNISTQNHHAYYITYWISEFVLCLLRLMIAVQVWWLSVHAYPAIWKISWRTLWFVAGVLSVWSALSAYTRRDWIAQFFYTGLQRFELMQAFVLVIILAFAFWYRIEFRQGYRLLLYGLCFYSVSQCIVAALSSQNPILTYAWFNTARELAYDGVLLVWICAVYQLLPSAEPDRATISAEMYEEMAPALNLRLRELNDRMTGMLNL